METLPDRDGRATRGRVAAGVRRAGRGLPAEVPRLEEEAPAGDPVQPPEFHLDDAAGAIYQNDRLHQQIALVVHALPSDDAERRATGVVRGGSQLFCGELGQDSSVRLELGAVFVSSDDVSALLQIRV